MESLLNKRETFKEPEYFDNQVKYNEESLKKFIAVVEDPTTAPDHRRRLRHTIFRRRLEQLITRYSRGDDIDSLAGEFPSIVIALIEYQAEPGHSPYRFEEFDAYVYALWLVALAILLDVPEDQFQSLVSALDNKGRDALYDQLVSLRLPGKPQASTLMYPNPYQPLFEALDSSRDRQAQLIDKFLKNYYKGMRQTYWHDSHLGEDAGFFGYWCFELAAFVKVLKIDDSTFADNIFYPRDLVRREQ